jgi:hypothetical protein
MQLYRAFRLRPLHLFSRYENSYKVSHVSHIKSIWHEKQGLNIQRKRILQTRQQFMAEVMSQPQPAGQVIMMSSPAPGRHSIELDEIQRRHMADRDPRVRGVC